MTTSRVERAINSRITRYWSAFGLRRTVWSDHRRFQFAQQGQDVAAGRPAENPEFVLERDHVHIAGVQEAGGPPVSPQVLLLNLEANDVGIPVAALDVVDRHREAPALGMPRGHRLKQVGRKRGNAAFARQVVAEKRDGSRAGSCFHSRFTLH
jgi:hypothetical protein